MVHLLVVILGDRKHFPALLQAWREAGVPGTTILESVGGYRAEIMLHRLGVPVLGRLFEPEELRSHTLLTVIDDEEVLERAIAEAERVVGGFDRPHAGLLFVLPITRAVGLHAPRLVPSIATLPSEPKESWAITRDTPVEKAAAALDLEPALVHPNDTLDQVAQAMLTRPNIHVACVVTEEKRLLGLLTLRDIVDDIFFRIVPEEFLSEVTDLEQVMAFTDKSRVRTAADAMRESVWAKEGETMRQAFERMHKAQLSGLPVVDDLYHVVAYIDLMELLAVCYPYLKTPSDTEGEQDA
jgi:CBS domain-containing protein